MSDVKSAPEGDSATVETKDAARRQFLKRAGQVAVTTQAVTLLLAAGGKPAIAGEPSAGDGKAKLKKDEAVDGRGGDGDCQQGTDSGKDVQCR